MPRRLAFVLVLPTILVCVGSLKAQSIYYYGTDSLTSGSIRGKVFSDSLTKDFELKGRGFGVPLWPNQEQKEFLPKYPYPQYFSDPRLPGIPYPDLRNFPGNTQPAPRVIPKRRDGIDIPNFRGWRIEKIRNLAKA